MFDLAAWRDIAILVLAITWIVLLVVVILLLLKIKSMIDQLSNRVGPLIDSARHTVRTMEQTATSIKGTASFVNRSTVTPIIRVAAIGAATARVAAVLTGRHKKRGG